MKIKDALAVEYSINVGDKITSVGQKRPDRKDINPRRVNKARIHLEYYQTSIC